MRLGDSRHLDRGKDALYDPLFDSRASAAAACTTHAWPSPCVLSALPLVVAVLSVCRRLFTCSVCTRNRRELHGICLSPTCPIASSLTIVPHARGAYSIIRSTSLATRTATTASARPSMLTLPMSCERRARCFRSRRGRISPYTQSGAWRTP